MQNSENSEIPLLESLSNNLAGCQGTNIIKNTLKQRCFPLNCAKYLRTPFGG